jgi:hypothetical protein
MHRGFWWGDLRERHCLEYLGIDGRILFKRVFKKWSERPGVDRSGSR